MKIGCQRIGVSVAAIAVVVASAGLPARADYQGYTAGTNDCGVATAAFGALSFDKKATDKDAGKAKATVQWDLMGRGCGGYAPDPNNPGCLTGSNACTDYDSKWAYYEQTCGSGCSKSHPAIAVAACGKVYSSVADIPAECLKKAPPAPPPGAKAENIIQSTIGGDPVAQLVPMPCGKVCILSGKCTAKMGGDGASGIFTYDCSASCFANRDGSCPDIASCAAHPIPGTLAVVPNGTPGKAVSVDYSEVKTGTASGAGVK